MCPYRSAPAPPVIQLATIDATAPVPHVRCHIFRSFLSATPSHPLLLTSTDIRTPKTSQIISNPHVELGWWFERTQEQFRLAGLASVVPTPAHPFHPHFLRAARGHAFAALTAAGFDWEAQRRAVFDAMSGHMKASWCRPVPGTRLAGGYADARAWPESLPRLGEASGEDERRLLEEALGNFALVVVDPTEVDYVELGIVPNQRTRFWRNGEGTWEEEAIVP